MLLCAGFTARLLEQSPLFQGAGAGIKGIYSFQLGALAVLSTSVQLLAGSKTLALLTGLPFWSMTLALAAIAYSYSRFSGIKASVATDVVQLGIILLGGALLVAMSLQLTGGVDTVIAGLGSVTGEYGSLVSASGVEVLLSFGLPTAVGLISGPFGDQCFWQRAFSIREDRIGRSFFAAALLFALVPIAMGTVGFLAAGSGFQAADPGMVNFEFAMSMLPDWVLVPFLFMVISGLLSTVDSNLCAAASLTTDWMTGEGAENIRASRRVMLALLLASILIANIPGLTVTHLFLFYGTLRASTLLPTVMTLLGKRLSADGVYAGVLTALCVGLPIFACGNLMDIPALKTIGSLTTVLSSGAVAIIASRKEVDKT